MKLPNLFIINVLRKICQLPIWWLASFHKRDPKTWVFGAWFGNSYSDNAKNMYEYVLDNHPEINAVWITGNKTVFELLKSKNRPVVLKGTKEARLVCLNAGYVFITIRYDDVESLYVNGAKQVWLWHGMPIKYIGRSRTYSDGIRMKIHKSFPQCKNTPDYFISTSHRWDAILNEAFPVKEEILITGLPRNDSFFINDTTSFVKEIDMKYNKPLKILYMPTFRDNLQENGKPFDPFSVFGFSMERFVSLLNEVNAVFLYKGHYYDIQNQHLGKSGDGRFVLVDESMYDDMYSFIKDVDILMTDYSSIYFDFLLLKRPVILAPFDKEEYYKSSRLMYFDYDNEIKGVRAFDWNEVMEIIREKKYYVPEQKVIDGFHEYQDGNSTERVTNYFLNLISASNK